MLIVGIPAIKALAVATDAARFALTGAEVNNLDWVKVTETGLWHVVTDNASLDTEAGWQGISAPSGSTPPTPITATANVKFGAAAGTGITQVLPASPAAGDRAKYYITASGGDRTLDFDSAIKRPGDSGLSLPKTLTSALTYIVLLEFNGTNWMLVSLVGGYAQ